jgi:hypothetical protein
MDTSVSAVDRIVNLDWAHVLILVEGRKMGSNRASSVFVGFAGGVQSGILRTWDIPKYLFKRVKEKEDNNKKEYNNKKKDRENNKENEKKSDIYPSAWEARGRVCRRAIIVAESQKTVHGVRSLAHSLCLSEFHP